VLIHINTYKYLCLYCISKKNYRERLCAGVESRVRQGLGSYYCELYVEQLLSSISAALEAGQIG
jgi:hypothetical protein